MSRSNRALFLSLNPCSDRICHLSEVTEDQIGWVWRPPVRFSARCLFFFCFLVFEFALENKLPNQTNFYCICPPASRARFYLKSGFYCPISERLISTQKVLVCTARRRYRVPAIKCLNIIISWSRCLLSPLSISKSKQSRKRKYNVGYTNEYRKAFLLL